MPAFICTQCGNQFAHSEVPPEGCAICQDERQFVRWQGQSWTTADELSQNHRLEFYQDEGVIGIAMDPSFAVGQRALLVDDAHGCVLWDCVSIVTRDVVDLIRARGGLKAIAISHPHFYGAMGDWSDAFGGVPIYLHADDRQWIMRPHAQVILWNGERHSLSDKLTLIRCGGHFPGGTVMHWQPGAGGAGALLAGDILSVTMDRAHVAFMYSFPNQIPLGPTAIRRIARALDGISFARVYGTSKGRNILSDGRVAFDRSIARYLAHISY